MNLENELEKKESLKTEEREKIAIDTTKKAVSIDQEAKTFIAGVLTGIQLKSKEKKSDHS